MNRITVLFSSLILLGLLAACQSTDIASVVNFEAHQLEVALDVPNHQAKISDTGQFTLTKGWNIFQIYKEANITDFTVNNSAMTFLQLKFEDLENNADLDAKLPGFKNSLPESLKDFKHKLIVFESNITGLVDFTLSYEGIFNEDVSNTSFSNKNVGREISGTILDQGAYFSPSSCYYPMGDETMVSFALTANIPEEWESIVDGNSLNSETKDGRKIQSWENPFKNDGLMFMAAPFVVKSMKAGDIDVYCYFFEEDTSLFETYLPATVGYVHMYSDLIGPYPYKRFTVAENFFPTGYGMPAWTLLGQQVIRLPFIVMTSLGHEVLHNWWGNSVYVDYDRGNWCEGSTVYGADYAYKLKRSKAGAMEYRKDILKQYKSYVNEDNDFPIREFTGRHNAATRTIGYNKTMMVFHMIEEEIGTEDFFKTWKTVYKELIGKQISFEEWIETFEKVSGTDLSYIIPQWIDRTGAPTLGFDFVSAEKSEKGGMNVTLNIFQTNKDVYTLKVPLRFANETSVLDTFIHLTSKSQDVTFHLDKLYSSVSLDPDFHLFRNLYPDEIEPILASVMGQDTKYFICDDNCSDKTLFTDFAKNVEEGDASIVSQIPDNAEKDFAGFYYNPQTLPDYLTKLVKIEGETIIIDGKTFPLSGNTFILSGVENGSDRNCLTIYSGAPESLPRLGQLMQHYGKYSYLVFKGARNIAKGQWPTENASLMKKITL